MRNRHSSTHVTSPPFDWKLPASSLCDRSKDRSSNVFLKFSNFTGQPGLSYDPMNRTLVHSHSCHAYVCVVNLEYHAKTSHFVPSDC